MANSESSEQTYKMILKALGGTAKFAAYQICLDIGYKYPHLYNERYHVYIGDGCLFTEEQITEFQPLVQAAVKMYVTKQTMEGLGCELRKYRSQKPKQYKGGGKASAEYKRDYEASRLLLGEWQVRPENVHPEFLKKLLEKMALEKMEEPDTPPPLKPNTPIRSPGGTINLDALPDPPDTHPPKRAPTDRVIAMKMGLLGVSSEVSAEECDFESLKRMAEYEEDNDDEEDGDYVADEDEDEEDEDEEDEDDEERLERVLKLREGRRLERVLKLREEPEPEPEPECD